MSRVKAAEGDISPSKADESASSSAFGFSYGANASSSTAEESETATTTWMKLISSTFLGGESSSNSNSQQPLGTIASSSSSSSSSFFRSLTATKAQNAQGNASSLPAHGQPPCHGTLAQSREQHEEQQIMHGATHQIKIALVGGAGVGKTSIVRRWLQRSYQTKYSPTVGIDVHVLLYNYNGEQLHINVWDVASTEVDAGFHGKSLHSLICDGLDGIFFVFNVHRVSSIAAVDKWRQALSKYVSSREIPFFLLCHKADLLQKRIMTSDDIAAYARAAGYQGWMWTVGRASFGENERHPAVMASLEQMVNLICQGEKLNDFCEKRRRNSGWKQPLGLFAPKSNKGNAAQQHKPLLSSSVFPFEVLEADDSIHRFSPSFLRLPTKAITTLPREEMLRQQSANTNDPNNTMASFGGNWIVGEERGLYLTVTDDLVLPEEETEEEQDEPEDAQRPDEQQDERYQFPFDGEEQEENVGEGDEAERAEQAAALEFAKAQQQEREAEDDAACWRFFAGSINRARAESLLAGREEGTFLLRRKDSQTLILSYMGSYHVHHALIEYAGQRYHVGSAKNAQVSFPTLAKCLRSVRKHANRGLVFGSRSRLEFRVGKQESPRLQSKDQQERSAFGNMALAATPTWRERNQSFSSSASSESSPKLALQQLQQISDHDQRQLQLKKRHRKGLQAKQGKVQIPTKQRIDELSLNFYEQIDKRLVDLVQNSSGSTTSSAAVEHTRVQKDVERLLQLIAREKQKVKACKSDDAELLWRNFVKNMETWNRLILNLEIGVVEIC